MSLHRPPVVPFCAHPVPLEDRLRPSWVEIDLGAITHNVSELRRALVPADLCAVVKADAYGHGDVPAAEAALRGGAAWLAVALVEEAVRLREAGIKAPILLLSEPAPQDAAEVVAWRLRPTVYGHEFVAALARASGEPYPVHLKIDTGMHRVGADMAAVDEILAVIAEPDGLDLEALWTHFAVSEEDETFTRMQIHRFDEAVIAARADGARPRLLHAANTAGALGYPEARYDLARIGLGIYGLRPAPSVGPELELRPAMRVVSKVSMVRALPAGERISYGRRRPLPSDGSVATVPIGYADGVARRLSDRDGAVLVRGRRYPFAGTVTMDQIVIDIGDDAVEVGDEVVLLGRQGDEEIGATEWADRLDTISYEVVCGFGPRLPRHFRGAPE